MNHNQVRKLTLSGENNLRVCSIPVDKHGQSGIWYGGKPATCSKEDDELCVNLGVKYNRITSARREPAGKLLAAVTSTSTGTYHGAADRHRLRYYPRVAHLKEMNHSKRFWDVVTANCPDWRQRKQWLEDHEAELNAINL